MINYASSFWAVDPATIAPYDPARPRQRKIRGGPLINLRALQALLNSGNFDTGQLWLATRKCVRDMQNEQWSSGDVLHMLVHLAVGQDYLGSEWCQIEGGRMLPCDAYAIPFDTVRKRRNPGALPVYLKFSIDEGGLLTIVLVSCHASS